VVSSTHFYRLPTRTVYPDLWWPAIRLIVEADSKEWHDDPLARYEDAERQAELEAAGERVLRVTSAQMRRPRQVLARLRAPGVQAK
jgi:very-short-patch-repair endonuclease